MVGRSEYSLPVHFCLTPSPSAALYCASCFHKRLPGGGAPLLSSVQVFHTSSRPKAGAFSAWIHLKSSVNDPLPFTFLLFVDPFP